MKQPSKKPNNLKKWYSLLAVALLLMLGVLVWFLMLRKAEGDGPETPNSGGIQRHGVNYKKIDTTVDVDFRKNPPLTLVEKGLLAELKICDTTGKSESLLPCSEKAFDFIQIHAKKGINDCFLLVENSRGFVDKDSKWARRRILIYERGKDKKLICVNRFKAHLTEVREREGVAFKDLLLRFRDRQGVIYYCLFEWVNGRYALKKCEELYQEGKTAKNRVEKGFIRLDKIDSISNLVKGVLEDEQYIY
ncbi:MAG: hypothetical protein ACKO4K_04355 [Flavobacteriales bacterium]